MRATTTSPLSRAMPRVAMLVGWLSRLLSGWQLTVGTHVSPAELDWMRREELAEIGLQRTSERALLLDGSAADFSIATAYCESHQR